jgi:glycerol-3-phosphate dehydrogenase
MSLKKATTFQAPHGQELEVPIIHRGVTHSPHTVKRLSSGMKLTSSHPFGSVNNGLPANYPSLQHNVSCDAVVIGGGIIGALVAVHLSRPAALFSKDGGQVDPHRLTHGLLAAGKRAGLEDCDRTKMTHLEETRRGVRITTHNGCEITARRVVIAAGFESKTLLNAEAGILKSTYALISEPLPAISGSHHLQRHRWRDHPGLFPQPDKSRCLPVPFRSVMGLAQPPET